MIRITRYLVRYTLTEEKFTLYTTDGKKFVYHYASPHVWSAEPFFFINDKPYFNTMYAKYIFRRDHEQTETSDSSQR